MSSQKIFMKMKMMKTVKITGATSTQMKKAVIEMKIPEALMNTTASVMRREAAGDWCGANTLWMYKRSLAMTAPMIWIQIDGLLVSVRFFHRPLSSDYRAIILGFLTEHVERKTFTPAQ